MVESRVAKRDLARLYQSSFQTATVRSSEQSMMKYGGRASGLLLLLAVLGCGCAVPVAGTIAEGEALVRMMTLWGKDFPSWIPGTDPCHAAWNLVACKHDRVISLNLLGEGISGTMPKEIGQLTGLTVLVLDNNRLDGRLPDELANCRNLTWISIMNNGADLEFSPVLAKLPKLEQLWASNAGLKGQIPEEFYNVTSLKTLFLLNNAELTGNLDKFCQLTNLLVLSVGGIKFEKYNLPRNLSLLSKLQHFHCGKCQLTGIIPASYGNLRELRSFIVSNNLLTGGLPDSFKNLAKLTSFFAQNNFLMGPFPNWIFDRWPNLTNIAFHKNQFYGAPYNISYLESTAHITTKFLFIHWSCNYLSGPEPCGAAGNNNCSEATRSRTSPIAYFYFRFNCYDDVEPKDSSSKLVCGSNRVTCSNFRQTVLLDKLCPPCPPNQKPLLPRTVDLGCPCH